MQSQLKLIHGRWVITGGGADDAVIDGGAVLVNGSEIAEIGDWRDLRERHPDAEAIGGNGFTVLPGLVNAHHHSGGVTCLQQGLPDMLLEPWILAHLALRPLDIELSTLLSATRSLKGGVTTVVDVVSGRGTALAYDERIRKALSAYDRSGIRVALAAGISTQCHFVHGAGEDEKFLASLPGNLRTQAEALLPGPDAVTEDEYLAIIEAHFRAHRDHPRIDLWFAPPGPQWVSDGFMQRIAESAASLNTNIQTHVTESVYEKLHGPRFYGHSTMEHLHALGVLNPRFSIAHGVWLTEAEIALMAETGAAISHNPSSNLRLRAGIAPVNALLQAGVTTGLGMDGTSLNDDEDMFTEMRLAMRLHRTPMVDDPAPPPARVFEMATTGGAKLMGKEKRLGRIAPGFAADLVLVNLERAIWPWVAPEADPRDLVLMRSRGDDVDTVLVDGKVALRAGQPTGFDAAQVGRQMAERLATEAVPLAMAEFVQAMIPHQEAYYRSWDVPVLEPYVVYNARH